MVRSVLHRKIYRDLLQRKLSLVALLAIIMIGVGCYAGLSAVYRDLNLARENYYNEFRIGDFTVDVKRAPLWSIQQVQELPNVRVAQGRVSLSVRVLLKGNEDPIIGQAISLPFVRQPRINDILLRQGVWFSKPEAQEVILNETFATANGLGPGDYIKVLFLEQEYELLIIGTAISPEFVYLIPPSGGLAPDPARFGVMYLSERFLQEASNLLGAYNQIVGQAHDRKKPSLSRMFEQIEERLDPYGVSSTTAYYDQPSIKFLQDELEGLKTSSSIMPVIFLGVATLVLNILIGRMVSQQRTIIGTLKALGHGKFAIGLHYMSYGLVIGFVGGTLGACMGYVLQHPLLDLYHQFYTLPSIPAHFYPDIYLKTMLLSCFFALLGTIKGIHASFQMTPAVAMRPPMPEKGGKIFPEYFTFFWSLLPFSGKMIMRTIFRNPLRSLVGIFASIIATALILSTLCNNDALYYLIEYEFRKTSHEDIQISLRDPGDTISVAEVSSLAFMSRAEPELNIVSDISHGPYKKRVGLTGLPVVHHYNTPLLNNGEPLMIPESGIVLSDKLAEILVVKPGDIVRVRPLIGRRQVVYAPVVAVVNTYLGLSAYADIRYLSRLIGEDVSANLLRCRLHTKEPPELLLKNLNKRPKIVGINIRERAFKQIDETFGETMGIMIGILVLFAGAIAFGSVLNSTLVSLSEREREVCTLRVLGYSPYQITKIFAGESFALNGIGIFLGLFLGIGLTYSISSAYSTELYRFPVTIYPIRFLHTVLLMSFFVGIAQIVVYQIIRKIHWLDGLKTKE